MLRSAWWTLGPNPDTPSLAERTFLRERDAHPTGHQRLGHSTVAIPAMHADAAGRIAALE